MINYANINDFFKPELLAKASEKLPRALLNTFSNIGFLVLGTSLGLIFHSFIINPIIFVIAFVVISFAIQYVLSSNEVENKANKIRLLYFSLFTLTGYYLYPYIYIIMNFIPGGSFMIALATISTLVLSFSMAGFSYFNLNKGNFNFGIKSGILLNVMLCLLAVAFLNLFFHMPLLTLIYSIGSAFVFSMFIMGDVTKFLVLANQDYVDEELLIVVASGSIALSIVDVFISILNTLLILNDKNSRDSILSNIGKIFMVLIVPIIAIGAIFFVNSKFEETAKASSNPCGSSSFPNGYSTPDRGSNGRVARNDLNLWPQ